MGLAAREKDFKALNKHRYLIGQTVKRSRRKKGLEQIEVSALIGVSRLAISKIETGNKPYSRDSLVKVCEALAIDWLDFVNNSKQNKQFLFIHTVLSANELQANKQYKQ